MSGPRYVARSAAIAARGLGDEMMVMSAADSTLFTLNEVARVIWEAADGVTPLEEIVRHQVCTRYEVAEEQALQDAEELVAGLAEHGLLLVSEQPLAAPGSKGGA